MVSSGCQVLEDEPERFIDYIFADPRLRGKIYDEDSFASVLKEAFSSDPTLKNIVDSIKNNGESLTVCGKNIYNLPEIQRVVKTNSKNKKEELRERVMNQRPRLKGKNLEREVERRYKISVAVSKQRPGKQVTIEEALKPIKVKYFDERFNKEVKYSKTKSRSLSKQERMLITNSIKKGKTPSQTIKNYYDSGLAFRSKESIRKHFYRLRRKL